jgi:hypothetical protein
MHVGGGERDVAQAGGGKFPVVRIVARDFRAARVGEFRIKSVARKRLALKQRPTVAMETIRAELIAARIVFGHE